MVDREQMYLCDSGGQYSDGTTVSFSFLVKFTQLTSTQDVTRTLVLTTGYLVKLHQLTVTSTAFRNSYRGTEKGIYSGFKRSCTFSILCCFTRLLS